MKKTKCSLVPNIPETEYEANKTTLRCQWYTILFLLVADFLTLLRVFVVDHRMMRTAFVGALILSLTASVVTEVSGLRHPRTKYIILAFSVLIYSYAGTFLTFHVVLGYFFPLLYASQYSGRRIVGYTYSLLVLGLIVSVFAGYHLGVTDTNIFSKAMQDGVQILVPRENVYSALFFYFILPRSLILLASVPLLLHISNGIAKRTHHEIKMAKRAETDEMTGLLNRNKYLQLIDSYYPAVDYVSVIFWDANGLKKANDTYGHQAGDQLISCIAQSISTVPCIHPHKCFRIGGDEFVMIVENATNVEIATLISFWRDHLAHMNKRCPFPLSAAVGWSSGEGKNIAQVIEAADKRMYQNKIESKQQRTD